MNRVRHILQWMREGCACRDRRGTVLMECVLVLPLLTLLIFTIVQFALIWYAQIMTHYAAYNAARAALVYHPDEYSSQGNFFANKGVCWRAAVQSLSWVAASPAGEGRSDYAIPGLSLVPKASSLVERQVRVASGSYEEEGVPCVAVRVEFDYPLHVPVVGRMLAFFVHESEPRHDWEVWGWNPDSADYARTVASAQAHPLGTDYITLHANCVLPKPWKTTRFARVPAEER